MDDEVQRLRRELQARPGEPGLAFAFDRALRRAGHLDELAMRLRTKHACRRTYDELEPTGGFRRCPDCTRPVDFVDDVHAFSWYLRASGGCVAVRKRALPGILRFLAEAPWCHSAPEPGAKCIVLARDEEPDEPAGRALAAAARHLAETHDLLEPFVAESFHAGWHARARGSGAEVTIWLPSPDLAWYVAQREQYREANARQARLDHPSILPILDHGELEGTPYRVTPRRVGPSLRALLAAGPLPLDRAVSIGAALAEAMVHAHARGVVKAEWPWDDVDVPASGPPVLDDVPAFMSLPRRDWAGVMFDAPGALVRSPLFMAPEGRSGREEHAPAEDVYGVAAIVYRAASAASHVAAEDGLSLFTALQRGPRVPLREHVPDAPRELEALLARALDPKPERRPEMAQLSEALARLARR